MNPLIIILTILVSIFLILFILKKKVKMLIINSLVGLFSLLITKIFLPNITINIWSILIVGFGGIPGYLLVILLHLFGIIF